MISLRMFAWLTATVFPVLILAGKVEAAAPRMNVLMIVTDDMNMSLGCYGHSVVKSPNIDRLAQRGVKFDRAFCNYPVCNASRTSFLSGHRPGKKISKATNLLWLPELFQKHGYYTAAVGKVTHSYGITTETVKWDLMDLETKTFQGKPRDADEEQADGRTAAQIIKLLEEHKNEPFFICAGFWKPHSPLTSPKKYHGLYSPEKMKLPVEPAAHLKNIPPVALENSGPYPSKQSKEEKQLALARYFSCISYIDAQVGKIIDALDRLQLADNTVVVFFSDHGMHFYEHGGLRGKRTLYEESVRVPLIISVPGKKPGTTSPRLAELVDIYPTLAELCQLPPPAGLQGKSLVPLLDRPDREWKQAALVTVNRKQGSSGRLVRTERFAYMQWGKGDVAELYDLETDPQQYVNLADDPKHADQVSQMKQLLKNFSKKSN